MPNIQEEYVVIKLYKLVKGDPKDSPPLTNGDFSTNVETIIQELVGDGIIVEIEKG